MDDEDNAVCEKIVNEINSVFNKDRDLAGFEIIPMPSNQNKSPVVHVEHNLGLESWCIKHVYTYCHRTILNSKGSCAKYFHNDNLLKYLNCAILINPDCATFWNIRRQLVERNKLNSTKEFQFSTIVLCRKPKSAEAFAYRRWLFLFQSNRIGEESIDWTFELRLCEKCADRDASNYHAWTHRQWVVQKALHLLEYELYFTEKFIRKHISDYCCYHHRQFIFKKMLECQYFERGNLNFRELAELVNKLLAPKEVIVEDNVGDLLRAILPQSIISPNNKPIDDQLISFLYFINLLVSDLKLCLDLKVLFGSRESIKYHYRAILKEIFVFCQIYNNNNADRDAAMNRDHQQPPMMKVLKIEDNQMQANNNYKFLIALKEYEEKYNNEFDESFNKWCRQFLTFN